MLPRTLPLAVGVDDHRKMQSGSGSAHPTSLPEEEVDVPGRPDFVDRFVQGNRPIPATAVRGDPGAGAQHQPPGDRRGVPPRAAP